LHYEQSQNDSQTVLHHIQKYEQDRSKKLERLKKKEEDDRNKKYFAVLNWFCAAQSTASDHDNFRAARSPCSRSGEWILKHEKVQNWRELDPPISSILWINGIPGAGMLPLLTLFEFLRSLTHAKFRIGKTILASVIIDSCLQDTSCNTGYFYCKEEDPEKNECISIYRGLLSQLLNHCRELIPYCYEKYLSSGELMLTSTANAEQLLKLFFEKMPKPKQFIIVDGLDECSAAQRKLVLTFFNTIVDLCDEREPGKLRVLFISQDFTDIGKALQTATVFKLTSEDSKKDIKFYVQDWSKRIAQKYPLTIEQVEFIEESTLVRSQGKA
jgi:hypothetical protein